MGKHVFRYHFLSIYTIIQLTAKSKGTRHDMSDSDPAYRLRKRILITVGLDCSPLNYDRFVKWGPKHHHGIIIKRGGGVQITLRGVAARLDNRCWRRRETFICLIGLEAYAQCGRINVASWEFSFFFPLGHLIHQFSF